MQFLRRTFDFWLCSSSKEKTEDARRTRWSLLRGPQFVLYNLRAAVPKTLSHLHTEHRWASLLARLSMQPTHLVYQQTPNNSVPLKILTFSDFGCRVIFWLLKLKSKKKRKRHENRKVSKCDFPERVLVIFWLSKVENEEKPCDSKVWKRHTLTFTSCRRIILIFIILRLNQRVFESQNCSGFAGTVEPERN